MITAPRTRKQKQGRRVCIPRGAFFYVLTGPDARLAEEADL